MLDKEKKYLMKLKRCNSRILNSNTRFTQHNKVNLHWWSTESQDHVENVGDYLSVVVCNYMLQKRGLSFDDVVKKTKHLYGIGSIIQGGAQNATIWGSGLKQGNEDIGFIFRHTRKLDIRLVRGPRTRGALIKNGFRCPENYGDPALIMPLIYNPSLKKSRDYLVILHHESKLQYENSITPLYSNYREFIDAIVSSNLVISSSLHGIILAEAYGIPAILLDDDAVSNKFKYEDYYYSTERFQFKKVGSVEDALKATVPDLPDLTVLQQNIISSFPYDLWNTEGRKK